jgi:exosortase A
MHVEPRSGAREVAMLAQSRGLQAFASIAAVMAVVFIVYWPTSASMVAIWNRSETFAHGFLVVPAALWFVWTSRAQLAATEVKPWWPALIALAGAGFIWLLGELTSALAPTQWAMVLMVPCAVLALFGWGWLRVLGFPLAFLFFAVPFGEAFVPTLIDWTADFTVAAVKASGVPVFREGTFFVTPGGRWSVVEACSGIRYLIASLLVGVLYAWTVYRSPLRRVVFIGLSVVVPIVANWFRAYLIVMIGHLSDNRIAVGVDHILYGWVFFGIVIGLMFWIGSRWREDGSREPRAAASIVPAASALPRSNSWTMPSLAILVAAVMLLGAWPLALAALQSAGDKRPLQLSAVPGAAGWSETQTAIAEWQPVLQGPAGTQRMSFSRDGATVTLFIGYYRDQKQGSELVNSMNRLLPADDTPWNQIGRGSTAANFGADSSSVRTASLRSGPRRLRVWHWYWLDGQFTSSDTAAKLSLALDRLLMRTDTSAWIAISTSAETDADADQVLAAFVRDMGPRIQSAIAETASR